MSKACRGCGCTDEQACPEGCWWVIDPLDADGPLCSKCARDIQTTTTAKEST